MPPKRKYSDEERKQRNAESQRRYRERLGIEAVRQRGRDAWRKGQAEGKGARWNLHKNLKAKYGMTPADREALIEKHKGCCALCGVSVSFGRAGSAAIDHCHETGKIRGLLCSKCNTAIAVLGDDVTGLERALAYVRGESVPFLLRRVV